MTIQTALLYSTLICNWCSRPLSIYCDTYGTGAVPSEANEAAINKRKVLTPRGIRTHLGLNNPIYERTAAYGHFGRAPENDGGFSWEKTDLVELIKNSSVNGIERILF